MREESASLPNLKNIATEEIKHKEFMGRDSTPGGGLSESFSPLLEGEGGWFEKKYG